MASAVSSLVLRFVLAGLTTLSCACATSDGDGPEQYLAGTWERLDDRGRLAERITFDGAGTFHAEHHSYADFDLGLWDLSDVTGSYTADDQRIWTRGTTLDGYAFEINFTYYANADHFARGAFVLSPDESADAAWRAYDAMHTTRFDGTFGGDLRAHMSLHDFGGQGSYFVDYTDPIWGNREADAGDWRADGDRVTFETWLGDYPFESLDGYRAFGQRADHFDDLATPFQLWHTGQVFTRAVVLE